MCVFLIEFAVNGIVFNLMPFILYHFISRTPLDQVHAVIQCGGDVCLIALRNAHALHGFPKIIRCILPHSDIIELDGPIHASANDLEPPHFHIRDRVLEPFDDIDWAV